METVLLVVFICQLVLCFWCLSAKTVTATRKLVLWFFVLVGVALQLDGLGVVKGNKVQVLNLHDYYHYFIGAKYFDELRYQRLYACTVVALQENGVPENFVAGIRDLSSADGFIAASRVDAGSCKSKFSDDRWKSFVADIGLFYEKDRDSHTWQAMLVDFGNNAPPTYYCITSFILNSIEFNDTSFYLLSATDLVILAVVAPLIIWYALGSIMSALYLSLLFNNYLSPLAWIIGSFGRSFWMMGLLCAYVFLVRGRLSVSALFFAVSAVCRIFPVIHFFFAVCAVLVRGCSINKVVRAATLYAIACIAFAALSISWFGISAWQEFISIVGIRVNMPAPPSVALWKAIAYFSLDTFPPAPVAKDALNVWLARVGAEFDSLRWVLALISAGILAQYFYLMRRSKQFSSGAVIMAFVAMFLFLKPLAYYYMFLPFSLLFLNCRQPGWKGIYIAISFVVVVAYVWSVPFLAQFNHFPDFYELTAQISFALLLIIAVLPAVVFAARGQLLRRSRNSGDGLIN